MSMDMVRLEAQSLDAWIQNANLLAQSSMVPAAYRGKPENILVAQQTGAPLGFGTMESINGIVVLDGKPTMTADLVQAAVRKAGHKLRVSGDDTYAEAIVIRADDPDFEFRVRWDMQRAKTAGLLDKRGGAWNKYPAAMLRARAITEVARMACADALHGVVYTPEELGADVTEAGEPIQMSATPRQTAQQPPAAEQPAPAAPAAAQPPAAPRTVTQDWAGAADACSTVERVQEIWREAARERQLDLEISPGVKVSEYLQQRAEQIKHADEQQAPQQQAQQAPASPADVAADVLADDATPLDIIDGELIEEEIF